MSETCINCSKQIEAPSSEWVIYVGKLRKPEDYLEVSDVEQCTGKTVATYCPECVKKFCVTSVDIPGWENVTLSLTTNSTLKDCSLCEEPIENEEYFWSITTHEFKCRPHDRHLNVEDWGGCLVCDNCSATIDLNKSQLTKGH